MKTNFDKRKPPFATKGNTSPRLSTLILIFCCLIAPYTYGFEQSDKISVMAKEASLATVFQQIEKQTGYSFFYSPKEIDPSTKVTAVYKNESLAQVLHSILDPMYIRFTILKHQIILKKGATNPAIPTTLIKNNIQQQTIIGKVTDKNGVPIPGVKVSVNNGENIVVTNVDGKYTIKAKPGDRLTFSMLGFKTNVHTITKDETILNVTLNESALTLDQIQVVSTGYQTLSKERSAGSFSKPDMDIVQNRTYSMNILQRIDGLVAGLTINNSPGAASNPYLIRGLTTIEINRSPLFVVNGIPTKNISNVNPQDVEDITVLKDATASSIWGARAANGVIVITTKKGKFNSKLKIQYDAFINFQGRPDLDYQPYMNSSDFITTAKEVFDPESYPYDQVNAYVFGGGGIPPHLQTLYDEYRGVISGNVANAILDSLSSINNRDQIRELWYRPAVQTNHTLTLSTGGDKHSVYASMAYTDTKSDRPGDTDKLYKINVRQDFRLNEKIKSFLITDFTKSKRVTKNNLEITNSFLPYQLFRDASGNNLYIPYMGMLTEDVRAEFEARSNIDLNYNPLNERNYSDEISDGLNARLIGGLNIEIFDNLKFNGTYSYIAGSNKISHYTSPESYIVRSELAQFTVADSPNDTPVYYLPEKGGRYTERNISERNYTIRNQLSFDKSWNDDKHQINILLGQEAREHLTKATSTTVRGYNPLLQTYLPVDYETLENIGVANTVMPNFGSKSTLTDDNFSQSEVLSRFSSYYFNLGYTFKRKYTINGSWRTDKSNLFGLDKSAQNKPTWSVGGKWSVGKESFMANVPFVDFLALRATCGITGNAPTPGMSSTYDILRPQTDYATTGSIVPLTIQSPGNPMLTWESTKTTNFGIDFGMFGAINASVDFYIKKTDNLLGQLPLNVFSGFSSAIGNFGAMENKGVELTLNTYNIQTENFGWTTLFTMAYNKNKITELVLPGDVTTGDQKVDLRYLKGYPAFAVFAYDYQGLDAEGDPLIRLSDGTITKDPNVTTAEDILYMGTTQPVWSGGLSNSFRYKNFNLTINAIYNLGHVMRKDVNTDFSGMLERVPYSNFINRWRNPGDELITDIPSFDPSGTISGDTRDVNYYIKGDKNVLDASYVKLRDITLSYRIPKKILDKLNIDNLTFRLSVSNILLWTANKSGIDPEFQYTSFGSGHRAIKRNQGSIAFGLHLSI